MTVNFWRASSSRIKRIFTIAAVFVLALIATIAGTFAPLSASDANAINQQLNKTRENISVQVIFGNNMMICLIMFIPIIGPLFGLYVLFNTGTAIEAESMVGTYVPPVLILFALFFFPFTWLEFISYSVAIAASIWLTWRMFQGRFRKEVTKTCIFIAIAAVLLLVAAIIEYSIIVAMPPA